MVMGIRMPDFFSLLNDMAPHNLMARLFAGGQSNAALGKAPGRTTATRTPVTLKSISRVDNGVARWVDNNTVILRAADGIWNPTVMAMLGPALTIYPPDGYIIRIRQESYGVGPGGGVPLDIPKIVSYDSTVNLTQPAAATATMQVSPYVYGFSWIRVTLLSAKPNIRV